MLLAVSIAVGIVQPAFATTPEVAIATLNQQRAAYGIPPVTLDQSLLKPECNLGNHEIASPRTAWSATSSPWDAAPYHEEILYDPSSVRGSYGEYNGFGSYGGIWSCMWFAHEWRGGTPSFYWAAEASGPNAVPATLSAYEAPATPAEDVGIANPTGPNLSLYSQNVKGDPEALSATVLSPAGASQPVHLLPFGFNDAMLVVDHPLEPATTYAVSVQWQGREGTYPEGAGAPLNYSQRFSFTTAAPAPMREHLRPRLQLRKRGSSRAVWVESDDLLRGRSAQIVIDEQRRGCRTVRRKHRLHCGWLLAHRLRRSLALTEGKISISVPKRETGHRIEVTVRSKQFELAGNEVKAAFDQLILR